jgi:Xaa-Pro dipeptidase
VSAPWDFRAFSKDEHARRHQRACELLDGAGLAGAVCTAPELIYYFTGYEAHTHLAIGSQALVLSADGSAPILIIRDGDVPQADETVSLGEVRPFRYGATPLSNLVGEAARERRLAGKPLGLDLSSVTTTGALTRELEAALAGSTVSDCFRLLGQLRTILSSAEIAYVREARAYADAGIEAFYGKARVGMSEIELAAEIECALRSAGSDYPAIPTWTASGPRSHCQHGQATPRKLERGDLVHCEFSGAARRYQCVTMGSLVFGEPSRRMVEIADGGAAAYSAGLGVIAPGARIGDAEQAYFDALSAHGIGECGIMRFGVGISAAYPPVWENQISVQIENDDIWQPGMVFYIHSSLQSLDDSIGVLFGGSYLITDKGPERLDASKIELVIVD